MKLFLGAIIIGLKSPTQTPQRKCSRLEISSENGLNFSKVAGSLRTIHLNLLDFFIGDETSKRN